MDGMEGEKGKQLYFNLVNCLSPSAAVIPFIVSRGFVAAAAAATRKFGFTDSDSFSESHSASEQSRVESSQATAVSEYFIAN